MSFACSNAERNFHLARVRVRFRARVRVPPVLRGAQRVALVLEHLARKLGRGGELLGDEVQAEAVVHEAVDLLVARYLQRASAVAQHRDQLRVVRRRSRRGDDEPSQVGRRDRGAGGASEGAHR